MPGEDSCETHASRAVQRLQTRGHTRCRFVTCAGDGDGRRSAPNSQTGLTGNALTSNEERDELHNRTFYQYADAPAHIRRTRARPRILLTLCRMFSSESFLPVFLSTPFSMMFSRSSLSIGFALRSWITTLRRKRRCFAAQGSEEGEKWTWRGRGVEWVGRGKEA